VKSRGGGAGEEREGAGEISNHWGLRVFAKQCRALQLTP
jgi:hypothetical protein